MTALLESVGAVAAIFAFIIWCIPGLGPWLLAFLTLDDDGSID